jgi:sulfite exporter TauE/SafE
MKKIIFSALYFLFIAAPLAQAAGLVPCEGLNCTFCDLLALADRVIGFAMQLIFGLGTVMIVWGGFVIMFARENPSRAKKGREIITLAVTGILIALISWLILDTIFKVLATNWQDLRIGPWNQLKCTK